MEAGPGSSEAQGGADRDEIGAVERSRGRVWRFSLGTAMLGVVAAALAFATFSKVRMSFDPTTALATDVPAVFVIAVALTGMAIGGARRYSVNQALVHISTAYAVVTSGILFAEMSDRLPFYWLEFVAATTVAVPFAVQGMLLRARRRERCEKRRIKRWVELLILSHLNIALAMAGTTGSMYTAEIFSGIVNQARGRAANG
jgi:hypothetical protein